MSQVKIEHQASPPRTQRISSDSPEKEAKPPIKLILKRPKPALVSLNKRRTAGNGSKKKASPVKDKPVVPKEDDPNVPLQLNISTKAQKRRTLRTNIKVEESEDVLEARRREKERLERLESSKAHIASLPNNSLINFITPVDDNCPSIKIERIENETVIPEKNGPIVNVKPEIDEKAEDVVILDSVVKKPPIELVELSSDDEDYKANVGRYPGLAYIHSSASNRYISPQLQEEIRIKKLKHIDETLDKIVLTKEGRLLVNDVKADGDPDVYIADHLVSLLQPHQFSGIKFLYYNVIESIKDFKTNEGLGCILAHSMGLGKSIQVITFLELFFRVTPCKRALIICPINVIQNWQQEFNKWLPEQPSIREFPVFLLGDLVKTQNARVELVSRWCEQGGVLLLGYEMFRLLTMKRRKKNVDDLNKSAEASTSTQKDLNSEEAGEVFYKALVNPGPDLIVCDEGHRIKNLKSDVASALSAIRTTRRIVLTGYPLQNNLIEYYCMVDFVRPNFLGTKKHFSLVFDRPIRNGMCIDSTKKDIKLARQKTHVLSKMLKGFVQRRTHHLLKKILPQSLEYVVILKKTSVQKQLYKEFVKFIGNQLTTEDASYYNPLKAYAVCAKIWNHPDLLYKAWERQLELLDYTHLADALDAAEAKTNQFQNTLPATTQYNTPYEMQNGFQMCNANNFYNQSFNLYNNNHGAQQFDPYYNQYLPNTQTQHSVYQQPLWQNIPDTIPAQIPSTSTDTQQKKRRRQKEEEDSVFDKTTRKKRPKKKLVQLITDDDEGGSIPYYWADKVMSTYVNGVLTNSHKMMVALAIIHETVKRGEKILLFSTSLLTLSLIEDFLREYGSIQMEDGLLEWKRNSTYFRFDGSTSGVDREKMISQFNADPSIRLFLISTRAGSLGVNLVSASRVIIFDASWNPCHDAQAVCRIYRYGQQNKTYIYRLIMSNCMERAIFSRQVSKQGLQQRVVDEESIDANVTRKELENLITYDECLDLEVDKIDTSDWNIEDDLLKDIAFSKPEIFAECPFLHESLMLESEEQLSNEEKREAEELYHREKNGLHYDISQNLSSNVFPSTYDRFSSFTQPGINRFPVMQQNGSMSYTPFHSYAPQTIMSRGMMPLTNYRPQLVNMQYLSRNPPLTNSRPINRSKRVENRPIIVDEDLMLPNVSNPSGKVLISAGESVYLIRTGNGAVYLRDQYGQIADASQTKYAIPPQPRSDEIIELD